MSEELSGPPSGPQLVSRRDHSPPLVLVERRAIDPLKSGSAPIACDHPGHEGASERDHRRCRRRHRACRGRRSLRTPRRRQRDRNVCPTRAEPSVCALHVVGGQGCAARLSQAVPRPEPCRTGDRRDRVRGRYVRCEPPLDARLVARAGAPRFDEPRTQEGRPEGRLLRGRVCIDVLLGLLRNRWRHPMGCRSADGRDRPGVDGRRSVEHPCPRRRLGRALVSRRRPRLPDVGVAGPDRRTAAAETQRRPRLGSN